MSEMIERVARAIFSTNYHPSDGEFADRMFDNDDHPQEKRRAYRAARAALEAMAEVSDDFLETADFHSGRFQRSGEYWPVQRNFLRAIVDAALRVSDEQPKAEDRETG